MISIVIKINNIAHYKYALTGDTFSYFNQIIDFFVKQGLGWRLVIIVIIGFFWYVVFYPLSVSLMTYYVDTQSLQVSKWMSRYFSVVVLESSLSLITFGTWHVQLLTWLYIMDILLEPFILVILGIILIIVLVCTILFPFSQFFLLLKTDESDQPEQDSRKAMQESARLVADNIGTTIKLSLVQIFLQMRYLLNILLIIWLPIALMYLLLTTDIFTYETTMWIATSFAIILLIFIVYINSLLDAFFLTLWYNAFRELTGNYDPTTNPSWEETTITNDTNETNKTITSTPITIPIDGQASIIEGKAE